MNQAPSNEATTQVAHEALDPGPAEQAAVVPHRVFAPDTAPVGQGGAGRHDGPEEIRTHAGGHDRMPAGLAIPEDKRFPDGLRFEFDHLLEEHGKRVRDILDRLALDRVGS